MAITYNGTNIDKIVYNGTEIFGGGKAGLVEQKTYYNKTNFDYIFSNKFDGILVVSAARQGNDTLWVLVKNVSGATVTPLSKQKSTYSTSKSCQSVYKINCNAGSSIRIWTTNVSDNENTYDPNQASSMIISLVGGRVKFLLNCLRGVALCQ